MITTYPENPDQTKEISSLLAMAYIRLRQRQCRCHRQKHVAEICSNAENSLDDVDTRGIVRTGSYQNSEKERNHAGS